MIEENYDPLIKHLSRLTIQIQENPDQIGLIIKDFWQERAEAGETQTAHVILLVKTILEATGADLAQTKKPLMDQEDQTHFPEDNEKKLAKEKEYPHGLQTRTPPRRQFPR